MHPGSGEASSSPTSTTHQKILLSKSISRKSHIHVRHDFNRKFKNPQLEKKDHYLAKSAARRAVTLARATRHAINTKERSLTARIAEVEEYAGLLRQKRAVIRNRRAEADEQMGMALDIMRQHGVNERVVESDDEYDQDSDIAFLNDRYHPPTSDFVNSDDGLSDTYRSECSSVCDPDSDDALNLPSSSQDNRDINSHIVYDIGRPTTQSVFVDSGHGGSVAAVC
ncbi:hypothetical protein HWV62_42687 [Athelia sp. TMB]|nr:hypothetical protein HWV62_42687 [Athelia sp. TMB]